MHDETSRGDAAMERDRLQYTLLELLLRDKAPGLWSTGELAVAMADDVVAFDVITTLHAAGLVHVHGDFVFPTRAAATYRRLTWVAGETRR
jgi:hypothetical protein